MTENNSDKQAPEPSDNPTTEERILWEQEKQRIQLNRIAEATQVIAEVLRSDAPAKEQEPLSDQLSPVETLQTHMEAHGVNTQKVETELRDDDVWFDNEWQEMSDSETDTFRDYTMNQDHVEVDEWVERNDNRFPAGYVVELSDLEGLV